jgi:hypothetical protein
MVLRRDKQKTAGKAALEQALGILERLEALLWAESTKAKRDRVELRRAASMDASGITAAQAKVAELVAARRTNREVASELFISPRPWRRICRGSTASLESPLEANRPTAGSPERIDRSPDSPPKVDVQPGRASNPGGLRDQLPAVEALYRSWSYAFSDRCAAERATTVESSRPAKVLVRLMCRLVA